MTRSWPADVGAGGGGSAVGSAIRRQKIVDNWIDEEKRKDAVAKREAADKKAKTAVQQAEAFKSEASGATGATSCREARDDGRTFCNSLGGNAAFVAVALGGGPPERVQKELTQANEQLAESKTKANAQEREIAKLQNLLKERFSNAQDAMLLLNAVSQQVRT